MITMYHDGGQYVLDMVQLWHCLYPSSEGLHGLVSSSALAKTTTEVMVGT